MNLLDRISDANGWVLTLAGLATVFVTLSTIYLFLVVYSKITNVSLKPKTKTKPSENIPQNSNSSKPATKSSPSLEQALNDEENDPKESEVNKQPMDDTLPKMAAAAAVSTFLKMRKKKLQALLPPGSAHSPWISSARYQGLHNHPSRNPWNR